MSKTNISDSNYDNIGWLVREMDMNIQKYMSFVKAVEYGSFTKAAERLNYSQSGISRMIGDL